MSNEHDTSGDPHEEAHDTRKKSLKRSWNSSGPVAKLTCVFAGIAALATVAYTFIAGWQLYVMHSGQKSGAQQIWSAISNMNWQARSMDLSAKQAQRSLDASIDIARTDQRAWVAVVDYRGIPEAGKPFSISVTARNSGKTFARKLTMVTFYEPVDKGSSPNFPKELTIKPGGVTILAPNSDFVSKGHPISGDEKITQRMIDEITNGNVLLVVHGRITYDDIFKKQHWTIFCSQLTKRLEWKACATHNDADTH